MNRVYKISFQVYRIILISILPLFFFAQFMVGTAGHNSKTETTDYFLLAFAILTPILLTILSKLDNTKVILRKRIRFILIILILTSIGFLIYGLYDSLLVYQNGNFNSGDSIAVSIIIALIALSSTIIVGLTKNKI